MHSAPSTATFMNLSMHSSCQKPVLVQGMQDPAVIELRKLLAHWNVPTSPLNALFSQGLEDKVKVFQQRVFLEADGVVGPDTWQALFKGAPIAMPTLQLGSTGVAVVKLQHRLHLIGLYPVGDDADALDGQFGLLTQAAVQAFQRRTGLVIDGIVGDRTWHALSSIRSIQSGILQAVGEVGVLDG